MLMALSFIEFILTIVLSVVCAETDSVMVVSNIAHLHTSLTHQSQTMSRRCQVRKHHLPWESLDLRPFEYLTRIIHVVHVEHKQSAQMDARQHAALHGLGLVLPKWRLVEVTRPEYQRRQRLLQTGSPSCQLLLVRKLLKRVAHLLFPCFLKAEF